MGENQGPADLQEAVERSYRAQWGGRRFCLITAIALFVVAVASAVVLVFAEAWFAESAVKIIETATLGTSLVCFVAAVLFGLEVVVRLQREKGQLPDRAIHAALCCSIVTLASLAFLFFLYMQAWKAPGIEDGMANTVKFVLFLFSGIMWMGSVVMSSAGVTMLVTHRTDLLEVNNTNEGTALLFRKGHSTELIKLSIAALIPLILFVVALLLVSANLAK